MSSSYYPPYVIEVTPELTQPTTTGGSRELPAMRLGSPQDQVPEEVTSRMAAPSEKAALGLTTGDVVRSVEIRLLRGRFHLECHSLELFVLSVAVLPVGLPWRLCLVRPVV
ncbi:hypothetical protein [Streptomyces sp. NPDC006459]|uniref:hypothetical protein n=1 Tax=Streptomyces sp. NPDC006459 TaxID=3154303 RepID=UPI00339DBB01